MSSVKIPAPTLTPSYTPQAPRLTERSKYLTDALKAMQEGATNIRSPWELAARLGAVGLNQVAQHRTEGKLATAKIADDEAIARALMQKAQTLFPNDERAQTAFTTSPDAMMGALAKGYEPQTVGEGSTLLRPGQDAYTAPTTEVANDTVVRYDPHGMSVLGALPQSYGQIETGRHNLVGEEQGAQGLGIQQQNANTGAFSAQTGRMSFEERKRQGGFGTPGVGGAPFNPSGPDWEPVP